VDDMGQHDKISRYKCEDCHQFLPLSAVHSIA
jgi:hypothetical protein